MWRLLLTVACLYTNRVIQPAIRIRSSRSTDESPRCRRAMRPCLYASPPPPSPTIHFSYTRFNKFPCPLETTVERRYPFLGSYYRKRQHCNAIYIFVHELIHNATWQSFIEKLLLVQLPNNSSIPNYFFVKPEDSLVYAIYLLTEYTIYVSQLCMLLTT